MQRLDSVWRLLGVFSLVLVAITGCNMVVERSRSLLYPTRLLVPTEPLPSATPVEAPAVTAETTVGPTLTWPVPTFTSEPTSPATASPTVTVSEPTSVPKEDAARGMPTTTSTMVITPTATGTMPATVPESARLVFLQDGSVYGGNYWGAEPKPILAVPQFEARAYNYKGGLLALAQGRNVELIDLGTGVRNSLQIDDTGEVEYGELLWGVQGRNVLYNAVVLDAKSKPNRRITHLYILEAQSATVIGTIVLDDVSSVTVLRYDEREERILLVPRGENPTFTEIRQYDVPDGQLVATFPVEGQGDALLSPDGQYFLTEQFTERGAGFVLYELKEQGQMQPKTWQHPAQSYSFFPIWSPDGRYVAYLLRRVRDEGGDSSEGLGVWVLDRTSGEPRQILDENSALSSLVTWTPDGQYILGYHQEANQGSYFYVVKPDGGDRRILLLKPDVEVLGWLPQSEARASVAGQVDPWHGRFSGAINDPPAMAEVVAQFLLTQSGVDEQTLTAQLRERLQQAGWAPDPPSPRIVKFSEDLFVAQISSAVYILQQGRAQRVGSGQILLDARLQGTDLGLISAAGGGDNVQPAFELLRRQTDGSWQVLWSPQGQRYWIVTDGQILFGAEGTETLQVSGNSFGLDEEDQTWSECRVCPHRWLTATWVRQGDRYVVQSSLPGDAPPEDILWEMTQRTPYALLREFLRRLGQGLAVEDLLKDAGVVRQAQTLDLLEVTRRFTPVEESAASIRFDDLETKEGFIAYVESQRITRIERLGR